MRTGQEDSQSFKISDISKIISEEDVNILSKHRRKQSTKIYIRFHIYQIIKSHLMFRF